VEPVIQACETSESRAKLLELGDEITRREMKKLGRHAFACGGKTQLGKTQCARTEKMSGELLMTKSMSVSGKAKNIRWRRMQKRSPGSALVAGRSYGAAKA
jgi:hypothetical protein